VARRDPVRLVGLWRWHVATEEGKANHGLRIERHDEGWRLTYLTGDQEQPVSDFYLWGGSLRFSVEVTQRTTSRWTYEGLIEGDHLTGIVRSVQWGEKPWRAERSREEEKRPEALSEESSD
jgi:hypothetical protein